MSHAILAVLMENVPLAWPVKCSESAEAVTTMAYFFALAAPFLPVFSVVALPDASIFDRFLSL